MYGRFGVERFPWAMFPTACPNRAGSPHPPCMARYSRSMQRLACLAVLLFAAVAHALPSTLPVELAGTRASSLNAVFQWHHTAPYDKWPDGSKTNPTAYLWISPQTQKLRGLLILCNNVPEHRLVADPAIRKVAADNDLGILWCAPSFMNFRRDQAKGTNMATEHAHTLASLDALLAGLAEKSGYPEVATVPWLPIGESGHLLMVTALLEGRPGRNIAGVYLKNNHFPGSDRTTPILVVYGTAQEWGQEKSDYRTKWADVSKTYANVLNSLEKAPGWPLTYVIDGHSGHFDISDRLTAYLAAYIDAIAKARLAPDGSLKSLDLATGLTTGIAAPGHPPSVTSTWSPGRPWYPNGTLADEARAISAINWSATSQLVGFLSADGQPLPFDFNGITNLKSVAYEADGRTFAVRPVLLDKLPANFVGAGEPLATTSGVPQLEWLCGSLELLSGPDASGAYRVRVSLDRTWRIATYLAARQPAGDGIRAVVQPFGVDMLAIRHTQGRAQKIDFPQPVDVVSGTPHLDLTATSDAGLPVSFFVVSGPATLDGNRLTFTELPARTRFPVEVTVAAWQWGRAGDEPVKMADIVRRTFRITKPQ